MTDLDTIFYSVANAASFKIYDLIPGAIKKDPNHFSNSYQPMGTRNADINEKFRNIHRVIRRASEEYDFEAYNATIGGYLEVYERVDIDEIL
jgi:hypothetical protein